MPNWAHLMFQDAASPIMAQLILLHDHALLILSMVITLVGFALLFLILPSPSARYIIEAQTVEIIWTALPAFTLLFLAFPSLHLLYLMDEISNPAVTFKVIGHQWYWSYEYSDFYSINFDSYMIQTSDLSQGQFRLLEVDHRLVLPMSMEIRALITSADVIHSWTIPAMGMKVDAVPGRLNQLGFMPIRPGVFYGQCSEICGANHSFMPIAMEIVPLKTFSMWISKNMNETS